MDTLLYDKELKFAYEHSFDLLICPSSPCLCLKTWLSSSSELFITPCPARLWSTINTEQEHPTSLNSNFYASCKTTMVVWVLSLVYTSVISFIPENMDCLKLVIWLLMKEECKDFTNEQSFNWQLKQVISFFFLINCSN